MVSVLAKSNKLKEHLELHPKQKALASHSLTRASAFRWWCGAGSNRRHKDFQSFALPTELPHHLGTANIIKQMEIDKNPVKNDKSVPSLYV